MKSNPTLISIVVPIHMISPELPKVREAIQRVTTPIEVLLVIPEHLRLKVGQLRPNERIIVTRRAGRGQALVLGSRQASGDVIVFVHGDTVLPRNWDRKILGAFEDKTVIGGGFSLTMDKANRYLRLLILLSDFLFALVQELWGDRAIFVRSRFVKQHLAEIEIPMMEDVRLAELMKQGGRVVLLRDKVITSAATFRKYGMIRNTLRILLVRLWYEVGRDPQEIYNYYYRS